MLSRRVISIFVLSVFISLMWRQAQASPAPGKHFLIETEDEDSNEGTVWFIIFFKISNRCLLQLQSSFHIKYLLLNVDTGSLATNLTMSRGIATRHYVSPIFTFSYSSTFFISRSLKDQNFIILWSS